MWSGEARKLSSLRSRLGSAFWQTRARRFGGELRARCCCACAVICGCLRACLARCRSSQNAASGRPAPDVNLFPAVMRTDWNSRRRPYAISLVPRQDSPEVMTNSAQPRGPHISIGAAREIVHQPDVRKPILITAGFLGAFSGQASSERRCGTRGLCP